METILAYPTVQDPTVQAAPEVLELLDCFQRYLTKELKP